MRSRATSIVVVLILGTTGYASPPNAESATDHCADHLGGIATSLEKIQRELVAIHKDIIAQATVLANVSLDNAMSTLEGELQRAVESRIQLKSEFTICEAKAAAREVPLFEQTKCDATGHALDNLNRRVDELNRTLASRRAQVAALDKALNDQIKSTVNE